MLQALGGPLSCTHAMLPTPLVLEDRIRVLFASCDAELRGRIFHADFDRDPPFSLMGRSDEPVLDLGPAGAFDCDGVNPSQLVETEDGLALLYIGWRRRPAETPYTLLAGLAFSDDRGLSFARVEGPLLEPRENDRLFRTAPFVRREPNGFRMLYIGGGEFITGPAGKRLPIYSLKELQSPTLRRWTGAPRVLLEPDRSAGEIGFGRPVVRDGPRTSRLMLSVRTTAGYDLVEADFDPERGISGGFSSVLPGHVEPWEATMQCFGAVCTAGETELLFYNGDGFGRSGMGVAWRPRRRQASSESR